MSTSTRILGTGLAWLLVLATAACSQSVTVSTGGTVNLGDGNNGQRVSVPAGDRVVVQLSTTFWSFEGSSDSSVLNQVGSAAVSPRSGCVPGAGCGTTTATFDAVHAGRADITATRTSCGEAMRCVGDQGSYLVTVVVTAT